MAKDLTKAESGRKGGIASGIARRKLKEEMLKANTLTDVFKIRYSGRKKKEKLIKDFINGKLSANRFEMILKILDNKQA